MTGKPDAVFALGLLTWHSIEQERLTWASARLMRALIASDRVGRVLVADPWRSYGVVARRLLGRGVALPVDDRVSHHAPLRLRRRGSTTTAAVTKSYRAWDGRIRRAAGSAGLRRPAVITNDPLVAGFAPLEWAGPVTLYATDDMTAYEPLRPWWPALAEAYTRVAASGRAVCAVSETLLERIGPTGPGLVVPNGVDPSEWLEPGEPPRWFAELPRPRLLYTGTLDRRIDADLVEAVAARLPHASIVMLGGHPDEEQMARLSRLPGLVAHPSVGRAELAAVVHAADAGLLPHVRNDLTEAMSPLKLYEYLAAGLPVAAVDLPPLHGVSERVVIGEDFAASVERALALGRAGEDERRAFVERHSWEAKHEAILDLALRADPAG